MNNDRELFEKAMKIKLGDMCPSFKRYGEPAQDQYIVPDVQSAWIGYQAALFFSKERIAELEKDAERLDWLLANPPKLQQTSQECFILAVPSNRKAVDDLRLLEALASKESE